MPYLILAHGDPKDIHRYALDLKTHIRKGQYQAVSHAEILKILTSSPVITGAISANPGEFGNGSGKGYWSSGHSAA